MSWAAERIEILHFTEGELVAQPVVELGSLIRFQLRLLIFVHDPPVGTGRCSGMSPRWVQSFRQEARLDWLYGGPPSAGPFSGSGVPSTTCTIGVTNGPLKTFPTSTRRLPSLLNVMLERRGRHLRVNRSTPVSTSHTFTSACLARQLKTS